MISKDMYSFWYIVSVIGTNSNYDIIKKLHFFNFINKGINKLFFGYFI